MNVDKNNKTDRNLLIRDAFIYYGYTQAELAIFLGLNRSTVGKIINKTKSLSKMPEFPLRPQKIKNGTQESGNRASLY